MQITIEIPNEFVSDLVVEALRDEAYRFHERREYYMTRYEKAEQSIFPPSRIEQEQSFCATEGAKMRIVSEQLWFIADAIYTQMAAEGSTS